MQDRALHVNCYADLYAIQCSLQFLFIMDQDDVLHAIYMFHNFHLISFFSSNNQRRTTAEKLEVWNV